MTNLKKSLLPRQINPALPMLGETSSSLASGKVASRGTRIYIYINVINLFNHKKTSTGPDMYRHHALFPTRFFLMFSNILAGQSSLHSGNNCHGQLLPQHWWRAFFSLARWPWEHCRCGLLNELGRGWWLRSLNATHFLGEWNNTNLWQFWGISLRTMHCLSWCHIMPPGSWLAGGWIMGRIVGETFIFLPFFEGLISLGRSS